MKFELVEKEFDGKKSIRWNADTTEGLFTAPEWMTPAQLQEALENKRFTRTVNKTGVPYQTSDGRPVFSVSMNKVLNAVEVKAKAITVSNAKIAVDLQKVEVKYFD